MAVTPEYVRKDLVEHLLGYYGAMLTWSKEDVLSEIKRGIQKNSASKDLVEVVRCKDCVYFQPDFVLTNDKNRRPYTEEEIQKGKIVTSDIGINCGSRCERFGYWEENSIPVWFSENDFCSYGKRAPKERGGEK